MFTELNEDTIVKVSTMKNEPEWMREFRLKSLKKFLSLDMPKFGPKLDIDFSSINYYKKEQDSVDDWNKVNCSIKKTFEDLGVIEAENKYLGGVSNQYESEVLYHKVGDEIDSKGVIFMSTDDALKKYPNLFNKYFNHLVKFDENKFTALNGALWSGGSFIYIPPNVKLDRPLQSYFRIDSMALGQFERTIIIVDDGAELSYIEGCTAMSYSVNSLHAGVVEIYVGKNAKMRYSTIQNWSRDVYNLVTKRAIVEEGGVMEWVDGNIGSGVTMKYPSCILKGDNSVGNSISIAYARCGQVLDAGAKMIHLGKNTKSKIISKSIAGEGGIANYRGEVKITSGAANSYATVKCDTIILDEESKSDTYPLNIVSNKTSILEHEASVSKISEDKLFYLMSKGMSEEEAKELLIAGFISEFKRELPMEYAVELNRLIKEI
ncbi:MAG TPA: Fe-S cluster assembly protein SufB [Firmicutes bacterium]|nr:Fe-S cluster assembly protein SufB [Bacillota bacterium]